MPLRVGFLRSIEIVAQAEEWWYFGRISSCPRYDTLSTRPDAPMNEFAGAYEVFRRLKLDLDILSRIFKVDNTPRAYAGLGRCESGNHEAWSELARLSGKTIHFMQTQGVPEGSRGR